jgi:hypothetical protein
MEEIRRLGSHRDPLERGRRGRVVVIASAVVGWLAFASSVAGGAPSDLPGVALGSAALLHVERAFVVSAAVACAAVFAVRGWAGYFPLTLSTTGAEYAPRAALEDVAANDEEAVNGIDELRAAHMALARSMGADIRALERAVDGLRK